MSKLLKNYKEKLEQEVTISSQLIDFFNEFFSPNTKKYTELMTSQFVIGMNLKELFNVDSVVKSSFNGVDTIFVTKETEILFDLCSTQYSRSHKHQQDSYLKKLATANIFALKPCALIMFIQDLLTDTTTDVEIEHIELRHTQGCYAEAITVTIVWYNKEKNPLLLYGIIKKEKIQYV